ncbi:hypothetical protein ABIC01_005585 [Bradyrhizobium sp. RT4b]
MVRIEAFGVGTWDLDLNMRELTGLKPPVPCSASRGASRGATTCLYPASSPGTASGSRRGSSASASGAAGSPVFPGRRRIGEWATDPRPRAGVIRDEAGAARHLSGIFLDIDEEKQVEQALRTRETHLRSILHTIPDAMIVIDGHGIIQLFSTAAEHFG